MCAIFINLYRAYFIRVLFYRVIFKELQYFIICIEYDMDIKTNTYTFDF